MAISELPAPILLWQNAPDDLRTFVSGFVYRDDYIGGGVMRLLPEVRASIQLMLGDTCWQRTAAASAEWQQLPALSLWAPKYEWCYGYIAGHIKVFAVALTPIGMHVLTQQPTTHKLNTVTALADFAPSLAAALSRSAEHDFAQWCEMASSALRLQFAMVQCKHPKLLEASDHLAISGESALEQAAAITGLSVRQFRRVFRDAFGASPKQYQRAIRVDRMLRQLHNAPWEHDGFHPAPILFADQPHAIREFRAMTGLTPRQYLRAKQRSDLTLRSVPEHSLSPPPNPG
jgi:AraC-like DNA-binding protein